MLRRHKHALSQSTTPFVCTLAESRVSASETPACCRAYTKKINHAFASKIQMLPRKSCDAGQ